MKGKQKPFWEIIEMEKMSPRQWESLCDGCGQCCLYKVEDEFTKEVFYSSIACEYLDVENCQCNIYETRLEKDSDCLKITPDFKKLYLLPKTCSYRRLYEKKKLPSWHPLICQNHDLIHSKGISIKGKAISAKDIHRDDLENYLLEAEKSKQ